MVWGDVLCVGTKKQINKTKHNQKTQKTKRETLGTKRSKQHCPLRSVCCVHSVCSVCSAVHSVVC